MGVPIYPLDPDLLSVEDETSTSIGRRFSKSYQSSQPYNHICIDNFLPEPILDHVLDEIVDINQVDAERSFDRAQEKLKSSFNPESLPAYTKELFRAFNSRHFIIFLEEMTGITGLIPDPYFVGAGIHKTLNGGYLAIHADFNLHKKMMLERRLNVIIYLNRKWQEDWGGSFEVWDKEMTRKEASFAPVFNRMVCFSTGSDTFHGNPEPVNNPEGLPRLSIALYYYTATWDDTRKEHTTLFKVRPGSEDKVDTKVARRAWVQDILPPAVYRRVAGTLRRMGL